MKCRDADCNVRTNEVLVPPQDAANLGPARPAFNALKSAYGVIEKRF